MMIDANKTYEEHGDKKKSSPGQWLAKKDTKELIKVFNFNWHKEDKVYFLDESLSLFYECYLNPSKWKQVIETPSQVVEVIKEVVVEKPFNAEDYYKALLKHEYTIKPNELLRALRSLTRRDVKFILDIFEVDNINKAIDLFSTKFVSMLLGNMIVDNISVDTFMMSYSDVLLGTNDKTNIYLTPGFRIKITKGTEVKYC
tara:strand:- start:1403 stop:2002 length:600 start_codon:yes stop_codon:yes gene_type:complete